MGEGGFNFISGSYLFILCLKRGFNSILIILPILQSGELISAHYIGKLIYLKSGKKLFFSTLKKKKKKTFSVEKETFFPQFFFKKLFLKNSHLRARWELWHTTAAEARVLSCL